MDWEYPIVREDAGRLKIEVSDRLASPWLSSKYEAFRWTAIRLSRKLFDQTFAEEIREQIMDSRAPEFTPAYELEARLWQAALALRAKMEAARNN